MASSPTVYGIELGDIATWFSAIGTFAAVVVALMLARRDGKRREEDRYARGTVIASFLFNDVGIVQRGVELAQDELMKVEAAPSSQAIGAHILRAYQIIDKVDTSKISAHMDKVVDLPARHAVAMAGLPDNIWVVHRMLINQVNTGGRASVSAQRDAAAALLAQLAITRARLDAFMADFEFKFVT